MTFNGTKVGSAASGTSPGNGFVDLAFPTQYKTSNWGVEGGYQTSKATFALRWDYSKFENSNETLYLDQPVLRRQPPRRDVAAAGKRVQQVHGDRQTIATCRGTR